MAWDFETDPDFQTELDWLDRFVREEGGSRWNMYWAAPGTSTMRCSNNWCVHYRRRSRRANSGPVILVRSWAGRDTARYAWP